MSEFLDLMEEEDTFCCPDGTEPFPDFSVKTLEELGPCNLAITRKELNKLIYSNSHLTAPLSIRHHIASEFMKYFKIEVIDGD